MCIVYKYLSMSVVFLDPKVGQNNTARVLIVYMIHRMWRCVYLSVPRETVQKCLSLVQQKSGSPWAKPCKLPQSFTCVK